VGTTTPAGKYALTDRAYSQLLHKSKGSYTEMPPELRRDILAFYQNLDAPISTKTNATQWAEVLEDLEWLQSVDTDLGRPVVASMAPRASK
jgi:hypothetical protein